MLLDYMHKYIFFSYSAPHALSCSETRRQEATQWCICVVLDALRFLLKAQDQTWFYHSPRNTMGTSSSVASFQVKLK